VYLIALLKCAKASSQQQHVGVSLLNFMCRCFLSRDILLTVGPPYPKGVISPKEGGDMKKCFSEKNCGLFSNITVVECSICTGHHGFVLSLWAAFWGPQVQSGPCPNQHPPEWWPRSPFASFVVLTLLFSGLVSVCPRNASDWDIVPR